MRGSQLISAALLALALSAPAPRPAVAVDNCFDCLLGIWDDPGMTTNFGTMVPGQTKTVYLGIDFAAGFNGQSSVEFSVAGTRLVEDQILVMSLEPLAPYLVILGSVSAPADTSATSTGVGGCQITWTSCLQGDQVFARLNLFTIVPQTNKVLRVLRQYPPANPSVRTPKFTQCDAPSYTQTRVRGGCYILNWNGNPDLGCNGETVAVESTTWSGMKALFR